MQSARRMAGAAVIAAAVVLSGCAASEPDAAPSETGAEEPNIVITMSTGLSAAEEALYWEPFKAHVTEATDGSVTFEEYWSFSLLPAAEQMAGIGNGTAHFGYVLPPYTPQELPIGDWMTGLAATSDAGFPNGILQAAAAHAEMGLSSAELNEEFESQGLKLLAPMAVPYRYDLYCTSPVETLEDLQGKRVRVGGELWSKEAEALGMVPVNLIGTEIYEGLQRGVVDCVSIWPGGAIRLKLNEVAKHFTPVGMTGWNAEYLVMNLDVWNEMSDTQKQAMLEGAAIYFTKFVESGLGWYGRWGAEAAADYDVEFHTPSAELVAALTDYQAGRTANLGSTAPSAFGDAQAWVDQYTETMNRWGDIVTGELGITPGTGTTDVVWAEGSTIDLSDWAERVTTDVFIEQMP